MRNVTRQRKRKIKCLCLPSFRDIKISLRPKKWTSESEWMLEFKSTTTSPKSNQITQTINNSSRLMNLETTIKEYMQWQYGKAQSTIACLKNFHLRKKSLSTSGYGQVENQSAWCHREQMIGRTTLANYNNYQFTRSSWETVSLMSPWDRWSGVPHLRITIITNLQGRKILDGESKKVFLICKFHCTDS